jgi:hypothetical protein
MPIKERGVDDDHHLAFGAGVQGTKGMQGMFMKRIAHLKCVK